MVANAGQISLEFDINHELKLCANLFTKKPHTQLGLCLQGPFTF